MTEQMNYATYGRSRHRRRPVGHLRPRRREEREKANGRNLKALDPPNEHEDEATTNAHRTSTTTAATDSSAMANADGPEGCYYIPKRVHNCGMDMELMESSSPRDVREASSKSPLSSRPSAARAVARGADPPTRRSSSNNTSKSPARRRPSKWDASTPSLVSSNKTLPAQAPLTHSPGSRPSTPARSRSRRSASPATPPTPPRSPRSPSPERSRVNVNLTRSRSWDGRTKHYDRNRMKSFNSDTQDGGYTSSGGGSAAAASRLSKQLSGFDLSNNSSRRRRASANSEGRGGMVGTSSSSSTYSRKKAAKSSKSVGKQSSFKMTKHEAKSFLKDKVIPLMPIMGGTSCKKRCSRKQLERSDASLNNHNGKKNTTTTRGVGEDGSATYNSSNYDSDSYNSDDDESCSDDDESGSESDRSYYSSDEESDADSEVEASSYYSSDEERKEPEGRRRSNRSSFLSDPRDYHDKNSSFHDSEPGSDYGESGSEGCYSSDDSRDSDEDEEGNYQSSDDEGNETDSYASGSTHSHRRGRMSRRRNTESHGSSHRSRSRSRSSKSKKDEEFSESDFHSMSRRSTKSHRGSHRSRSMSSDSRRDEEVSDADSQTSRSSRRKSLRSSDSKTSTSRTREKARTNAKDDSDDTNSQSSNKTYAPSKAIANKKEFNESQKQLVGLIKENETLRSNVIKLRSDFETMLHHMNALEDSASTVVDGDSISSDDNSRVSHCLRRIEDAKTLALEKIEEEEQRRRMMGKKGSARKEMNLGCDEADVRMIKEFVMEGKYKDLQSYQQCIDDLLSENERLYSKVVALSKEREEITKEVHALRNSCSDNTNHKVFTLPAAISNPVEAGTGQAGTGQDLLTDKEVAKSHTQTMDNIASLIRGISILSKDKEALSKKEEVDVKDKKEEKEQKQKKERDAAVDAMGNEIMQLVSKILTQRVPVPAAAAQEDNALNDGEDVNDKEDKTSPFDSGDGDKHRISNRRRSEQSNHHNESFSSICTVTSSESNDDENRYIYKEGNVSSNSLFDGTSPSTVDSEGRGDNDDDDASTLEIIYEYETDSEDRSESAPSYTSQRSAYRDSGDDERYDDNGSYGDETYSTYKQEGKESYYPDEDVEYPPRGYHRYSPSTSRHSSRSSSTTKNRTSSGSEESGDRPSRRGKSFHSHCSSSKSERGNGIPVAIEDDKSPKKLAQDKSNDTPLPASKESQTDENKSQMDEHSRDLDKLEAEQEELVQAIESHLTGLPLLMRSSSFEASVSADTSSVGDMTYPSHNSCATGGTGSSTRECKCITITVVSRASRHVSFPSSPEHTYMTFFNATLMKSQVDAVLEEQFQETREILQSSVVTQARSNCSTSGSSRGSKKKKYQGEYNENGHRHGYGIYTSKNGNEYRGEWQHNKREGLGVVKIGNGDVFEGQFECNLKNGIGVYHYKDGECDLSLYKDDARIGDSIRYSKDRTQAFLLSEKSARVSKSISFEVAAEIAKGMGTIVQC